jgi:transcriptional regulator with XRE-family HTH domain
MDKTIFTESHRKLVQRLKEARKKTRLNQVDVAEKLGRSQSYISKMESGQCRIDTVQLKEFAAIYKKEIAFFLK